jgi:hypothetical protein
MEHRTCDLGFVPLAGAAMALLVVGTNFPVCRDARPTG